MRVSEKGLDLIKRFEGRRLKAYRDSVGVLTVGFGHTDAAGPPKVHSGMEITAQEAEDILRKDLTKYEDVVNDYVTVPLNQNQFDALVSFCFNLGPGNLKSSTLLKKLNAGDYDGAASEFGKWTLAGGRRLRGLVRRRKAERDLFREYAPDKPTEPHTAPKISTVLRRSTDYNPAVEPLQAALGITVDGWFGPLTEKAVTDYQEGHGLMVDGLAGPETLGHLGLA